MDIQWARAGPEKARRSRTWAVADPSEHSRLYPQGLETVSAFGCSTSTTAPRAWDARPARFIRDRPGPSRDEAAHRLLATKRMQTGRLSACGATPASQRDLDSLDSSVGPNPQPMPESVADVATQLPIPLETTDDNPRRNLYPASERLHFG